MTTHYEKALIEEKKRLTAELGNISRQDSETGEWQAQSTNIDEADADSNDNADRYEDFEEKSSLIIPLEKRLMEVDAALERIDDGTYGKCVMCKGEIEKERLDANHAAETCIKHLN